MAVIVKNIFIYIKKTYTYLPYVPNMFTKYEKKSLKNCRRSWLYTIVQKND